MSMLGNAKSNRYRKTHQVELGGTGRKFQHLTWGDLQYEGIGEVSRGRSSEEVSVMGMEQRAEGSSQLIQGGLLEAHSIHKQTGVIACDKLPLWCGIQYQSGFFENETSLDASKDES